MLDARGNGIHHPFVVPWLLATFMAGPAGLALYFIVKLAHRVSPARRVQHAT